MTTHIFGMGLTHEGTFSNNRGENEGNTNTLQKVIRNGDLFSTVSAEAIRYALRDGWQQGGETLNRRTLDHRAVKYNDRDFDDAKWPKRLDDDVLGFMHARDDTVQSARAAGSDARHFRHSLDRRDHAQLRLSRFQSGSDR